MLKQEDIDYCNLQQVAVASITGDDIHSIFHRFQELFPIYNRLYNLVPAALTAIGQIPPKRQDDNARATSIVVQYLGSQQLLDSLSDHANDEDIDTFTMILDNHIFHIKLRKDGSHDVEGDNKLAAEIKSSDPMLKATAILYFIYYVRCNIFHGQKHREEDQRLLLTAATRILQTVKDQLYHQLATQ
jgi:hypothetical protein